MFVFIRKHYDLSLKLSVLSSLLSCSTLTSSTPSNVANLNGTLWYQNAAEFRAHSLQAFAWAKKQLQVALKDKTWSALPAQNSSQSKQYSQLPPAIIVDIDETILDNTTYDAQKILEGTQYDHKSWDQWIALAIAPEMPGAIDFLNHTERLGIQVYYVTNRRCQQRSPNGPICPQVDDNIKNLKRLGINKADPSQFYLLMQEDSSKVNRRLEIAQKYRILLLVGDDILDFMDQRDQDLSKYQEFWGKKWIMLSNPKYGSWLRALFNPQQQHLKGYK